MRKILLLLIVLLSAMAALAQQLDRFSQYMLTDYLINPAFAGSRDYFDVRSVNRYQWAGLTDAPRTFSLSVNGPLRNEKMGLGGSAFTDVAGPTRRTGLQFSYAYHLQMGSEGRLAFALSAGLMRFGIDASRIKMIDQNDPALYTTLRAKTVFDAKLGVLYYTPSWFVGFTAPQMLQNRVDLFSTSNQLARLEDHYLLMGGYSWDIDADFTLKPTFLLKYVHPAPLDLDISARVVWRKMVHAGLTYRHRDAIALFAGYEFDQLISVSYAYDLTTSRLGNYTTGTHEFVLGLRFNQR